MEEITTTDDLGLIRARDEEGRFIGDDPLTPNVNEAWTVPLIYEWKIRNLKCIATEQKIVKSVAWTFSLTKGGHYCDCCGEIELDYPEDQNFIQYENLTEDIVIEWVKTKLSLSDNNNEDNLKLVLNQRISLLESEVSYNLPWN